MAIIKWGEAVRIFTRSGEMPVASAIHPAAVVRAAPAAAISPETVPPTVARCRHVPAVPGPSRATVPAATVEKRALV
jgi:hypothetical protein